MNQPVGVKKSNFTDSGTTAIPSTATFDYVSGSQNLKVTFENLLPQLGTTGSIVQTGDTPAFPVLDDQGTIKAIRNLVEGTGISMSITPSNGIEISTGYTFDETGVTIVDNTASTEPNFRSYIAGTGIQIAGGTGTIEITATGTTAPTNQIIINQESDFPVQDGSTITLSAGIIYVIGASFSTAKRFIVEDGAVWTSFNQFGAKVTYTGSGTMFTGTDASFTIRLTSVNCPAAEAFNFTDSTGTKLFICEFVSVESCTKWGTYEDLQTVLIQSSDSLDADDGMTINGTFMLVLSINKFGLVSTSATYTYLDIGTVVIANIEINDAIGIAPAGAEGIVGTTASANVPSGAIATVTGSSFSGGMNSSDALVGITIEDIRWEFAGNTPIPDSISDSLVSMQNNSTQTVISVVNTPVKVAGTYVVQRCARFNCDTTGRSEYIAERDIVLPVDVSMSVTMATGTDNITAYFAVNGSVISDSGKSIEASAGTIETITIPWQVEFSETDYLEVFVENNSDTTNIIVVDCIIRIR